LGRGGVQEMAASPNHQDSPPHDRYVAACGPHDVECLLLLTSNIRLFRFGLMTLSHAESPSTAHLI
jgi:hypothetical protein